MSTEDKIAFNYFKDIMARFGISCEPCYDDGKMLLRPPPTIEQYKLAQELAGIMTRGHLSAQE